MMIVRIAIAAAIMTLAGFLIWSDWSERKIAEARCTKIGNAMFCPAAGPLLFPDRFTWPHNEYARSYYWNEAN